MLLRSKNNFGYSVHFILDYFYIKRNTRDLLQHKHGKRRKRRQLSFIKNPKKKYDWAIFDYHFLFDFLL